MFPMIVLLCVPIRPVTRGAAPVLGKRQMILRSQLFECLGIGFSLVGQQNRHGACLGDDGHEVRVTIPARHHMLVQVSGDSCACYFALINADIVTVRTGDGFITFMARVVAFSNSNSSASSSSVMNPT